MPSWLVSQIGGPLLSIGSDRESDWASASDAPVRNSPAAMPTLEINFLPNTSLSRLAANRRFTCSGLYAARNPDHNCRDGAARRNARRAPARSIFFIYLL